MNIKKSTHSEDIFSHKTFNMLSILGFSIYASPFHKPWRLQYS